MTTLLSMVPPNRGCGWQSDRVAARPPSAARFLDDRLQRARRAVDRRFGAAAHGGHSIADEIDVENQRRARRDDVAGAGVAVARDRGGMVRRRRPPTFMPSTP